MLVLWRYRRKFPGRRYGVPAVELLKEGSILQVERTGAKIGNGVSATRNGDWYYRAARLARELGHPSEKMCVGAYR